MPTKRVRVSRSRTGGDAEIEAAAYYFRFGYLLGGAETWGSGKTEKEIMAFWRANKTAILAADDETRRKLKKPFFRCYPLLDELEAQHPRKQTGKESYTRFWREGPEGQKVFTEPVFETDQEYLTRLGLLEPWEIDHNRRKGK